MKLPRTLAGLAGPSTPDAQQAFLRDLKLAFRQKMEYRAPPLKSNINAHLENIFRPNRANDRVPAEKTMVPVELAACELYIQGHLTKPAIAQLLKRSKTKLELDTVKRYSQKAGIDLVKESTCLSACYAARLLHLGYSSEVKEILARHAKVWMTNKQAHPVMVQYACRANGKLHEGRKVFDHLLELDERNQTTELVRALLRESVRAKDLVQVKCCLAMDQTAARGQETGLAQWLNRWGESALAFHLLKLADPSRSREGEVGLEIAKRMMLHGHMDHARDVLKWVESRFILSLQPRLRQLQQELERTADMRARQTQEDEHPETLILSRAASP